MLWKAWASKAFSSVTFCVPTIKSNRPHVPRAPICKQRAPSPSSIKHHTFKTRREIKAENQRQTAPVKLKLFVLPFRLRVDIVPRLPHPVGLSLGVSQPCEAGRFGGLHHSTDTHASCNQSWRQAQRQASGTKAASRTQRGGRAGTSRAHIRLHLPSEAYLQSTRRHLFRQRLRPAVEAESYLRRERIKTRARMPSGHAGLLVAQAQRRFNGPNRRACYPLITPL